MYEFLVVECCIYLNIDFLWSLLEFLILIVKVQNICFWYIWSICHVKAVQHNISSKTIRLWLHNPVCKNYLNYSITRSYANSFWGYVVLETFNNVSRDEDNILDQIYIKQIVRIYIMMIFDFHNIIRQCILTLNYS